MKHSEVRKGTVYVSPLGRYVVTEAESMGAFTTATLKPVGHSGAGFTTNVSDLDGPRAYRWKVS